MAVGEQLSEAASAFEVLVEPAREVVWVTPRGELDLATGPELREQVSELLEVGFERLVIDLRGLSFIDVAGLRLLLGLALRARSEGWRLSLIQGDDVVRRLFALTDTLDRLPFSPSGEVGARHGVDHHPARLAPRDGDRALGRPRGLVSVSDELS
jgi:anti-sigma B factor antagonist